MPSEMTREERFLFQAYPAGFLQKLGELLEQPVGIGKIGPGYNGCHRFTVPCTVCTTGGRQVGIYQISTSRLNGNVIGVTYMSDDDKIYLSRWSNGFGLGDAEKFNFPGISQG